MCSSRLYSRYSRVSPDRTLPPPHAGTCICIHAPIALRRDAALKPSCGGGRAGPSSVDGDRRALTSRRRSRNCMVERRHMVGRPRAPSDRALTGRVTPASAGPTPPRGLPALCSPQPRRVRHLLTFVLCPFGRVSLSPCAVHGHRQTIYVHSHSQQHACACLHCFTVHHGQRRRNAEAPPHDACHRRPRLVRVLRARLSRARSPLTAHCAPRSCRRHDTQIHNPASFMTENFGALAKEGIVLERHHTYKFCSPTRRSSESMRVYTQCCRQCSLLTFLSVSVSVPVPVSLSVCLCNN